MVEGARLQWTPAHRGRGGAGLGGRLRQRRGSGQWSHRRAAMTAGARLMMAQC